MTVRELWNRWRALFRRASIAGDLEEEMRLHAALRARRVRAGEANGGRNLSDAARLVYA